MERIKAARGGVLRCKGWRQEAILRMLENNLENAEKPEELIIYGGAGKGAPGWGTFPPIVGGPPTLGGDETRIIPNGKTGARFTTPPEAPRGLHPQAAPLPEN